MQRTLHLLVLFILLVLCEAAELKSVQLLGHLLCPATVDEFPELQGGSGGRMATVRAGIWLKEKHCSEIQFNSTLPEKSQVKKGRNWISYSQRKKKLSNFDRLGKVGTGPCNDAQNGCTGTWIKGIKIGHFHPENWSSWALAFEIRI